MTGVAIPVGQFQWLDVTLSVRCVGLRGAGGAAAVFFFLNDLGKPIPGPDGANYFLNWADSSPWQVYEARVPVPAGAERAVLQFEKRDAIGWIRIDDVQVTGGPNAAAGAWTPYHTADDTTEWLTVSASKAIEANSALDVSFLLLRPAGELGFVTVKNGRLTWGKDGGRARFFGVVMLPPTAFLPAEQADALVDRLARSGVNLVRLGELDSALGPNRSLFDDTRDDTKAFDPEALARLDHLIAALKSRGIYVALELQAKRRFRAGDGVAVPGLLPPGGGPAAFFDPTLRKLAVDSARALLRHVNPETGLALKDDPVLAWVTLTGEVTLFNLIDKPESLPAAYTKALQSLAEKAKGGPGRRFWETVEAAHLKQMAEALRKDGLRVPIAGVSHWRREQEFAGAQAGAGLDMIDDRLFWNPAPWVSPEKRSVLWSGGDSGLAGLAAMKRRPDRPYVVGQICDVTQGAWSFPHEAADQFLGVYTALVGGLGRGGSKGGLRVPNQLGRRSGRDSRGGRHLSNCRGRQRQPAYLRPLAACGVSIAKRRDTRADRDQQGGDARAHPVGKNRRKSASGWDAARGRLTIDTAYTQGIAGWVEGESASLANLDFETDNSFAVLIASSLSNQPIATTKRLLVSAIVRVEPTGFRWVDSWKREVADPGRPPFLQEPVSAKIVWRRKGVVRAFVLDNNGARTGEAKLEPLPGGDGVSLYIDGKTAAFHWELTAE